MSIAGTNPCSIGEGMYRWTKRSILNRQKILSKSTNRSSEEINYVNNRKPWIKMASSVKVTNEGAKKLSRSGLNQFTGRKLAKNFVLFGGTAVGTNNTRAGIGKGFSGAYGIGGTDFGYKPMPGITNLRVRTKGRLGNLKEAQLSIKAYNKQQFDIIELLYLRLGYTVIVEFGHNLYISRSGEVRNTGGTIIDKYWFEDNNFKIDTSQLIFYNKKIVNASDEAYESLEGKAKQEAEKINDQADDNIQAIQNSILASKIQYQGHYDGIVGKVTNFDFKLDKNGVYSINLTIISYGDLMDSFYINTKKVFPKDGEVGGSLVDSIIGVFTNFFSFLFGGDEEPDPPEVPDIDKKFLKNAKDITDINGILYMFYDGLYNSSRGGSFANRSSLGGGNPWKYYLDNINKDKPDFTKSKPADIFDIKVQGSEDDTLGLGFTDDKYISLGYYLDILNKFTLGFIDKDSNKTGLSSIVDTQNSPIKFDNRQDRFFCNTHPFQISADPLVCLVKNVGGPAPILTEDHYRDFKVSKGGFMVGDIMNIYLQMNFLAELCYNSAKNKDAKISVKDHVEEILFKINEALGSINRLAVKIDEETGIAFIIDECPFPGRKKIQNLVNNGINEVDNVEFEVYGFSKDEKLASMVKDFGIKTKIPKELETIITIGAQDAGYTPGFDATNFASWNKGLEDTVLPALVVSTSNEKNAGSAKETLQDNLNQLMTLANKLYQNDEKVKAKYIEQTKNALTKYLTTEQALTAIVNRDQGGTSPANGIIPISLDLTIDGLSGIKVFQTYTINSSFLPTQYSDTLDFILKGYTHEINNKEWITKLQSFSIPTDSNIPVKSLAEITADKLASIIAEAQQELNDAEFNAQQKLFQARSDIRAGAANIAGGAASSLYPGQTSPSLETVLGGASAADLTRITKAKFQELGFTYPTEKGIIWIRTDEIIDDKFTDLCCVVINGEIVYIAPASTIPGAYWWKNLAASAGTGAMRENQQVLQSHKLTDTPLYKNDGSQKALSKLPYFRDKKKYDVYRDPNRDLIFDKHTIKNGRYGMFFHRAGGGAKVGQWSAGCQVVPDSYWKQVLSYFTLGDTVDLNQIFIFGGDLVSG